MRHMLNVLALLLRSCVPPFLCVCVCVHVHTHTNARARAHTHTHTQRDVYIVSCDHRWAALWSVACLHLGSPLCCAYAVKRLIRNKSLQLGSSAFSSSASSPTATTDARPPAAKVKTPRLAAAVFSFFGVLFFALLALNAQSVEMALTLDYYGAVLPLCGFIVSSERKRVAAPWVFSPVLLHDISIRLPGGGAGATRVHPRVDRHFAAMSIAGQRSFVCIVPAIK